MAKSKSKKKRSEARASTTKRASRATTLAARRPVAKSKRAKKAKKRASTKHAAKRPTKAKKARKSRQIQGEGSYAASREFDREQQAFVRSNKQRIPEMGRQAEAALDGPQGAELTRAEETARGHSHV